MSDDFDRPMLGPIVDRAAIANTRYIGGYGAMPFDALAAKFESTNMAVASYDDFARETLVDRRPDTATYAHEEARRSTHNKGILNILHSGGRGELNSPAHPEAFLEMTDRDPRQANVDPNFHEMRLQAEARMPYVKFGAGNADTDITGGGLRENQVMAVKQETRRQLKPRMRIFSTSHDGRREGMHRLFEHQSDKEKTSLMQSYSDIVLDAAQNPQRKSTILSNRIIRNTRMYHQNTSDHEFAVAKYGEDGRRRRMTSEARSTVGIVVDDAPHGYSAETSARKATGCLMGAIVKQKRAGTGDAEVRDVTEGAVRGGPVTVGDLERIMFQINHGEQTRAESDGTQARKELGPVRAEHVARITTGDASRPAQTFLEAEKIFASMRGGGDQTALLFAQDETQKRGTDVSDVTGARKTGAVKAKTGTRNTWINVADDRADIRSYKSKHGRVKGPQLGGAQQAFAGSSHETSARKTPETFVRELSPADTHDDTRRVRADVDVSMLTGRISRLDDKHRVRRYTGGETRGDGSGGFDELR